MTFGPATILAFAAAVLATLCWWFVRRPATTSETLAAFVFGLVLASVILAGPLLHLP